MSEKDNIYKDQWHDYKQFISCFGTTKIMPTDIDFCVERNGKFLIIEFKTVGKPISVGQDILLKKLSMLPNFSVWCVHHEKTVIHHPKEYVDICIYPNKKYIPINTGALLQFIHSWFKKADES